MLFRSPFFSAESAASESLGRLTDKAFGALCEHGFLHSMLPREFGGAEINALEALRVIENLSYADASTGWVYMATQVCTGIAAACLPDEGAKQLFSGAHPIVAGQGAPNGKAEVVPGGFRLTGKWSYGSGVLHSNHIHTGGLVVENGKPRMRADGREIGRAHV